MDILWTVLSTLGTILMAPTNLFWPVGEVFKLVYAGIFFWLAYKVYTWLPKPARRVITSTVGPSVSWATSPVRWYIVQRIADPGWLRQPGDPAPAQKKAVEPKPHRCPSRKFWFVTGCIFGVTALLMAMSWLKMLG